MTDERIAKLEAIGFAWVAPGFTQKARKRKRIHGDENDDEVEEDVNHELVGDATMEEVDDDEEEEHNDDDAVAAAAAAAAAGGVLPPPHDAGATEPAPFVPTPFYHSSPSQSYML